MVGEVLNKATREEDPEGGTGASHRDNWRKTDSSRGTGRSRGIMEGDTERETGAEKAGAVKAGQVGRQRWGEDREVLGHRGRLPSGLRSCQMGEGGREDQAVAAAVILWKDLKVEQTKMCCSV